MWTSHYICFPKSHFYRCKNTNNIIWLRSCLSNFWKNYTFEEANNFRLHLKGGFYSEDTDAFAISSNRLTLLFSWAWILKLWDFKVLKSCHIRTWSGSEGSNSKMEPYMSLQSYFSPLCDMIWALKNVKVSKFKLRKIIRFVCLRKWQMHQYFLNKSHL